MKNQRPTLRQAVSLKLGVFAGLIALAACGDDVTVPQGYSAPAMATAIPEMAKTEAAFADVARAGALAKDASAPPVQPGANVQPIVIAPSMVIRNGSASIEVDSLELAIAALQQLATAMGGYVGNTSLTAGAYQVRSAILELKIPAARYDSAVGSLRPIGKIESQSSNAQDVGEEFFDVTARQANAHRLEERLISLLATRTGKLEDVLAVERELARVREEIERYEGRLRYLKSHVNTSTLVVTVHERRPVVSEYTGQSVIVESFKNAWRNFVRFIALFIESLGWLVPLLAVLVVLFLGVRRFRPNTPKSQTPAETQRNPESN